MKERFERIWNKTKSIADDAVTAVKEFVEDHAEGIMIAAYVLYMGGIGYYSLRYMKLICNQAQNGIPTIGLTNYEKQI